VIATGAMVLPRLLDAPPDEAPPPAVTDAVTQASGDGPTEPESLSAYDALSDEDKAFLNEIAAAMLSFLAEYESGAFENNAAGGLSRAEQEIYSLQNSSRYKALLDTVNATGEQELLWPAPQGDAICSAFRIGEAGAATYHFDLFKGSGGAGYYIGSRGDTGDYSALHVIPYSGGTANGTAHYFVFPFASGEEAFVQRLQIQSGAAFGTAQITTKSGETREDDSNIAAQNWFLAWPEELN